MSLNDTSKQECIQREDIDTRDRKILRRDFHPPDPEMIDVELARKFDEILKTQSSNLRPKFVPNKTRQQLMKEIASNSHGTTLIEDQSKHKELSNFKLSERKFRNFEQLKERLREKYSTLTPEYDPERQSVRVVKVLSSTESLELAKNQAKKEYERQLKIDSVSGNLKTQRFGVKNFIYKDGSETTICDEKKFTKKPNQRKVEFTEDILELVRSYSDDEVTNPSDSDEE